MREGPRLPKRTAPAVLPASCQPFRHDAASESHYFSKSALRERHALVAYFHSNDAKSHLLLVVRERGYGNGTEANSLQKAREWERTWPGSKGAETCSRSSIAACKQES